VGPVGIERLVRILDRAETDPGFRAVWADLSRSGPPEEHTIEGVRTWAFRAHGMSMDLLDGAVTGWALYPLPRKDGGPWEGGLPLQVAALATPESTLALLGPALRDTRLVQRSLQYALGDDAWVWFVFRITGQLSRVQAATRASVPHLAT